MIGVLLKKGKFGHREIRIQGDYHMHRKMAMQAKERGLEQLLPTQPQKKPGLEFGLLASRTLTEYLSVV